MAKPRTALERPPRSAWFDPRFAVGIGLIVVSVAAVTTLVSSLDRTVDVWVASAALSPGDVLESDDVTVRSVSLGDAHGLYLAADERPIADLVVTRVVSRGELIPAAAVGSREGTTRAAVVVGVPGRLPAGVGPGASVDIWSARESEPGVFGAPAVLVGDATVVRIIESEGIIAGDDDLAVEVLVPRESVARVLESLANDDAVSLVPTSLPIGG
ncbi:hypothetical protein [Marisediminicola sp. LYQ85]|uniref:hypothetical protein n=1 Tax=Marisediminicola sp. LYQ85 TaxID=3391062 RepID=UPI0039831B1E